MPRATAAACSDAMDAKASRHLWRRVIAQAFLDATYPNPTANRKQGGQGSRPAMVEQRQARAWLTGNSPDFALVCEFAGLNAEMVRGRASDLERQGWPAQDFPYRGETKRDQLARARDSRRTLSEAA